MTTGGLRISDLPAANAVNGGDQLEVNQGGTSRRLTLDMIAGSIAAARLPPPGGVDDTVSIQAAIDAANGGAVVVPEAIYLVTSLIVPPLGITLVGEGPGSIIRQLPSAGHMIVSSGTSKLVQFIGLTLDGNQQNQASTTSERTVNLTALDTAATDPSRFAFRGCRFLNGREADIGLFAPDTASVQTYLEITNCYFLGSRDPGRFVIVNGTVDVLVQGNGFDFIGPHIIAGRSGVVFDDYASDGTATNRGTATIANNYFRNCGTGVANAIGAIDFYSGFSQITISGNRIIEPWGRGINVKADSGGVTITGNTVIGLNQLPAGSNGAMTSQIILLASVSDIMGRGNVVSDNVCLDSGNDGITVFGHGNNAGAEFKRNMVVANNVVIDPARYCLYGFECGTVAFRGNSTRGGVHSLYAVSSHYHLAVSDNSFELSGSHAVHVNCTAAPGCPVTLIDNQIIAPGGRGMHITFAGDCNVSGNSLDVTGNAPLYIINTTGTRLLRNNAIRSNTPVFVTDTTNSGPLYADAFNPANQSFALQYPDGGVIGGNARGLRAIDLQQSRSAATQVASGADSWAFGVGNTVSASNSGAIGVADGLAADAANVINLLNNSALRLDIGLIVRDLTSQDVASFTAGGVLIRRTNSAAATAIIGTAVFVATGQSPGFAGLAAPIIAADTINGGLAITVTALGANVTHWVASVKVTEVQ
jgi:hypothetical protein